MRYLKGDFWIDFLLLIPCNAIFTFRYSRLLFLLKCYRIIGVFALIKQEVLMSHVKAYYNRRLARIVKIEELRNNIEIDQNKVDEIIVIGFVVKIIKLIIVIFCIAWFMGIIYYIYCDIANDFYLVGDTSKPHENFIGNYFNQAYEGQSAWSNKERALGILYFLFTTLSTVGFGDFHPINEVEAAFTAGVLLAGVSIFSFVMGSFIEISDAALSMNDDFDDGDELSRFFGLLY